MARDYKNADRRKKSRRKSDGPVAPSWAWLLVGLGIGLSVAWFVNQKNVTVPLPVATTPSKTSVKEKPTPIDQPDERFAFYEMLPDFEVVIPEKELDVRRDIRGKTVTDPGNYILQTGSFQNLEDADRMQARLALLGLESRIEKVSIDSRTWHRVRIGPIENLSLLNEFRGRLWNEKIQFIVVHSPE